MNISSKDIKKRDFKKGLRGYDVNEVEAFLETVSSHYEKLVVENRNLNDKINSLAGDLEVYKENEQTLQKAIVKSQDLADEIVQNAKNKAGIVIKEAELSARTYRQELEEEIMHRKQELEEIKLRNDKLIEDVKNFIEDKLGEFDDFFKDRKVYKMELASGFNMHIESDSDEESSEQDASSNIKLDSQTGQESDDSDSNINTGKSFDDNFEVK